LIDPPVSPVSPVSFVATSKPPGEIHLLGEQVDVLADLGWDSGFDASYHAELSALQVSAGAAVPGRVLRRDKTACAVALPTGLRQITIAPGLLHSPADAPTTGDFVVVVSGEIRAVLERRTSVMRSGFRDLSAQVLAANVDTVLAVSSLSSAFRARRLERLLVIAWQTGATPIVVLTKADCCENAGAAYDAASAVAPGCAVHVVSAVTGQGIAGLAAELAPRTTAVMIGSSGAGKSTLANALSDGQAGLETADLRADGRGRHTTVARELVQLENGALMIDTPGLRAIGLWDAEEALGDAFSDVEELALACRFNDCAHDREPGCAVKQAIAQGHIDGARLESYRSLQREQRRLAAHTDARLRAERAAELRAFNKRQKQRYYR
jgi:ribosome biogenesis GTPase / thiamine phosphate phosphatase